MPQPILRSNFSLLREHDEQLLRLGMLAKRYFADDPNTSLLKLHHLALDGGSPLGLAHEAGGQLSENLPWEDGRS